MSQSALEAKNDNLTVSATTTPELKVSMEITVSPKQVMTMHPQALKAVNKMVSLPGFRKGKAPDHLIANQYSQEIKKEWKNLVVHNAINEAFALVQLYPFRHNPEVRILSSSELSKEKGMQLKIEFEQEPNIPDVDLSKCLLKPVEAVPISQEDVDAILENNRFYFAKWNKIEDRAVQENDFVVVDIEKLDEPQGMIAQDSLLKIAEEKTPAWIRRLLIGRQVKETVEATSEQDKPSENTDPEKIFIPTKCKFTIKAIQLPELPNVDDAFANKLGKPSLQSLKEHIIHTLQTRAMKQMHDRLRAQVNDWLLETFPFTIPFSMIKRELEGRENTLKNSLQEENCSEEEIQTTINQKKQELQTEAEDSCKIHLLLTKFANNQKLYISSKEIAQATAQGMLENFRAANEGATDKQLQTVLGQVLLLNKARDYIIQHAKYEKA